MTKNLIKTETFGSYVRSLRIKNNIGQRQLAKMIGVAPSYLNDMEKNKRSAPRIELIKKLSIILKANLDLLNDLAGNSKKTVAPDIVDYIEKNPQIVSLLRAAKSSKLSDEEIEGLEKKISKSKTKTLIVAAGLGKRFTNKIHKQFILINGKEILAYSVETFFNHPKINELNQCLKLYQKLLNKS